MTDSVDTLRLRLQAIVDAQTERVDALSKELAASKEELARARWLLWVLSSPADMPKVFGKIGQMVKAPPRIEVPGARQPVEKRRSSAIYRREDVEHLLDIHGPLTQGEIANLLGRNPRELACLNLWARRKLLGKIGNKFCRMEKKASGDT